MTQAVYGSLITITFVLLAVTAGQSWAHSGEIHLPREYQPTSTEFGSYDPSLEPQRTIEVLMHDSMRFDPPSIEVRTGEVVHFRVTNAGDLMHEFVLGTGESLAQHAEMMKKFPGMEHDEPYLAHVPPGETMDIVWKFEESGDFGFACLVPGHYDAGMSGDLVVK